MEHLHPVFIHEDTLIILSFSEWINVNGWTEYGAVPYDSQAISDLLVKTNPPNSALSVYPELSKWNRLYRTNEPSKKIWQKTVLLDPYQDSNGNWIQEYAVVSLNPIEMIPVNTSVYHILDFTRQSIASIPFEVGDKIMDSSYISITSAANVRSSLMADTSYGSIDWEGPLGSDGLPQFFTMDDVDVLEQMGSAAFVKQQNGYKALKHCCDVQKITPYDSLDAAASAMVNKYNELEGV